MFYFLFFFFKQKTAYELRISYWSSDVCSSDLREEEKKLVARLENLASLDDLRRMQHLLHAQLGIALTVAPGLNEVRTVRGLHIEIADLPGLCSKTRQTLPAAIRRGLERMPEIIYALLDSYDLLRSEEHTSELQSLMRISYAVFCLQKK